MEAYYFLMGFYTNNLNVHSQIRNYSHNYNLKVEKTLMDKMEYVFFIAGVYDSYIGHNIVMNEINNLVKLYKTPESFEAHYKTLNTNLIIKGIYDEIYTNMKELMELTDVEKNFLEITYINGRIRINQDAKLATFIAQYKYKSETYNVTKSHFYIAGLIESYKKEYKLDFNCF
jgi:hypothetical protein